MKVPELIQMELLILILKLLLQMKMRKIQQIQEILQIKECIGILHLFLLILRNLKELICGLDFRVLMK
jgi:hypothetical protein